MDLPISCRWSKMGKQGWTGNDVGLTLESPFSEKIESKRLTGSFMAHESWAGPGPENSGPARIRIEKMSLPDRIRTKNPINLGPEQKMKFPDWTRAEQNCRFVDPWFR